MARLIVAASDWRHSQRASRTTYLKWTGQDRTGQDRTLTRSYGTDLPQATSHKPGPHPHGAEEVLILFSVIVERFDPNDVIPIIR